MVNTLFSCLCTLDDQHSFVPRWRPPLHFSVRPRRPVPPECAGDGRGETEIRHCLRNHRHARWLASGQGHWRVPDRCALRAKSWSVGLSMPHSPRIHGGRVWLLNSGNGRLVHVDLQERVRSIRWPSCRVTPGPGSSAGLSRLWGSRRFGRVATFGGVPIAADRARLKCGVAIVDLASGQTIGLLEFHTGIEEIFDVRLVPDVRSPLSVGAISRRRSAVRRSGWRRHRAPDESIPVLSSMRRALPFTDQHDPVRVLPPSRARDRRRDGDRAVASCTARSPRGNEPKLVPCRAFLPTVAFVARDVSITSAFDRFPDESGVSEYSTPGGRRCLPSGSRSPRNSRRSAVLTWFSVHDPSSASAWTLSDCHRSDSLPACCAHRVTSSARPRHAGEVVSYFR